MMTRQQNRISISQLLLFALGAIVISSRLLTTTALPVIKNPKDEQKKAEEASTQATPDVETALEYERYLKEVVEALESDSDFRKKLDKAPEADIRSGKIAQELDYVNHNVRSKLDEIKRREIERLRSLANKEYELENNIDRTHLKIPPQHLDHGNEHTFEIEDLRKLIKKTSEDLAEADRRRRAEFKEYEMQKEFERETQLKEMDEQQRLKYEQEIKEQQQKHKKHEKVHHPGNKAQLEDVWEKQDHMDRRDFDPHTFFMIHDVDGNGFWDETEVKALFIKELDKVYQSGLPEDDMRERAEEMERMREHVFKESDTNQDGLISFNEFLEQTKRDEFNRDPEWETVDEQPQYTHEEYLDFEKRRQEEIQRMMEQGLLPPHPNMPQGYHPQNNEIPHGGAYQQQHPEQPPQEDLHYQNPNQIHQQQQQQYHQQQQQYQQQQQQQQQYHQQQQQQFQGQPVQLNPNQVYQNVQMPQQPQQQQQYQPAQQQQQQQYQKPQQQQPQQPQQQQYQQVQQPQQAPASNVAQNSQPIQTQQQQQQPIQQQPIQQQQVVQQQQNAQKQIPQQQQQQQQNIPSQH